MSSSVASSKSSTFPSILLSTLSTLSGVVVVFTGFGDATSIISVGGGGGGGGGCVVALSAPSIGTFRRRRLRFLPPPSACNSVRESKCCLGAKPLRSSPEINVTCRKLFLDTPNEAGAKAMDDGAKITVALASADRHANRKAGDT